MPDILGTILQKIFGSSSERYVKRSAEFVRKVNELEPEFEKLTDEELKAKTEEFKKRIEEKKKEVFKGKSLKLLLQELQEVPEERRKRLKRQINEGLNRCVEEILPEIFAAVREACKRNLPGHRHFDVQLIGGKVLHEGKIAEMATGEGKTLVATLPAYVNVLLGLKVHIVSVNDYLVKRDRDWMAPIYEALGLTVGAIQSDMDPSGDERRKQYECDITYGTNNELGFDYLRDNMKVRLEDQVQGPLHYAIIDEVDSILIDEARTPLIISGPAHDDVARYKIADRIAKVLIDKQKSAIRDTQKRLSTQLEELRKRASDAGVPESKFEEAYKKFKQDPFWITDEEAELLNHTLYFVVERDRKSVHMTHDGVTVAQEEAGLGSFYVGANMEWPHLIDNALRAHLVYQKDIDYVVQNGEVIIVDEFTGRLMYGRQWSEGLHQAVEAKEGVPVKEETQTLATITIQNFFKLYCKLAGMTGTAMTESEEFNKIYDLDVFAIPTNRPVNRVDHDDKIYRTMKGKFDAIVEEIRAVSIQGFPDDPDLIAKKLQALKKVYQKLKTKENKNLTDEEIEKIITRIDDALKRYEEDYQSWPIMRQLLLDLTPDLPGGRPILVGTTSIENSEKLSNMLTRKYGIEHEVLNAKHHAREAEIVAKAGHRHPPKHGGKRPEGNVTIATNMAGRGTDIKLEEGVVYPKCIGDLAPREPGVVATKCCINCPEYDGVCAHCFKPKLDPRFPEMGRTFCRIEPPCGLHVIGTERHEARRIDNQLRGRSGRQGDPGSSRFFLSLEDDLLRIFAGDWVLKMLDWLGMEEGMAIENKRISKGIERAQKKVEERNFAVRKNLLEYDEVMDYQRQVFYRLRQRILESKDLDVMIWGMIEDVVREAVDNFLDPIYPAKCIVEWVRTNLNITVNPEKLDTNDFDSLVEQIKESAIEEAVDNIQMTLGEYLDPDLDRKEWDYRGLAKWAMSRFHVNLSISHLTKLEPEEIQEELIQMVHQRIEKTDFSALTMFLTENFAEKNLAEWAKNKFAVKISLEEIKNQNADRIVQLIIGKVKELYQKREVEFPVEFALNMTLLNPELNSPAQAATQLSDWVWRRFRVQIPPDDLVDKDIEQVRRRLVEIAKEYIINDKLKDEVNQIFEKSNNNPDKIREYVKERFEFDIDPEEVEEDKLYEFVYRRARNFLRSELTRLEQIILLNIYDGAWKEHLLAMDHLKQAIGFRGYAERDPKIEYKREGTAMFHQMLDSVAKQVTDIIMKVEVTGPVEARSVWSGQQAQHEEFGGLTEADQESTMSQQSAGPVAVKTIKRDKPKVRPNDPCPCGSGKKYKKCCGRLKR